MVVHNALLRNVMNTELTEEEMRRALFGDSQPPAPAFNTHGSAHKTRASSFSSYGPR